VNDDRATQVRIDSVDGTSKTVALTQGYFLAELGATSPVAEMSALDSSGTVVATYDEPPVVGLPASGSP
jgi:hypothetical protein